MLKPKGMRLTQRQAAKTEHLRCPSCRVWVPFIEGSGDTFTEYVSGGTFSDAEANSSYNVPHTVTTQCDQQSLQMPNISKNVIAITMSEAVTVGTNGIFYFGYAGLAEGSIWMGNNRAHFADGDVYTVALPPTAGVAVSDASAGSTYLNAAVWDNPGKTLTKYRNEDGAGSAISGDTASTAGVSSLNIVNSIKVGNTGGAHQHWYGAVLLEVDVIPSDLTTRLDKTYADWISGIKTLRHFYDL